MKYDTSSSLCFLAFPFVSMLKYVGIGSLSCEYRSAGALQSAQEALAHSMRSENGEELFYADGSFSTLVDGTDYQKVSRLNDYETKLEKGFSGDLTASEFSEYPVDPVNDMIYDITVESSGCLTNFDGQSLKPSIGGRFELRVRC